MIFLFPTTGRVLREGIVFNPNESRENSSCDSFVLRTAP